MTMRTMSGKSALALAAGLLLVVALSWPHLAASRVGEDMSPKLHKLQQLDMVLTRDVLRVAIGHLRHYDTLDATNRDIDRLSADLSLSLERDKGAVELRRTIEAYRALHARRAGGIERFKTAVARLRNSAQHFPRVVGAFFSERLSDGPTDDKLAIELKALLTDVLVQQISHDAQRTAELKRRVHALSAQAYRKRKLVDPELLVVTKHANVIVTERAKVEEMVARLASQQGAGMLRHVMVGR